MANIGKAGAGAQGGDAAPVGRAAGLGRSASDLANKAPNDGAPTPGPIRGRVAPDRPTLRRTPDARREAVAQAGQQTRQKLSQKLETNTNRPADNGQPNRAERAATRAEQAAERAAQQNNRTEVRADARDGRVEARADTKDARIEARADAKADRVEARADTRAERVEARVDARNERAEVKAERNGDNGREDVRFKTEVRRDDGRTEIRSETRTERGETRAELRAERGDDGAEFRAQRQTSFERDDDGDRFRSRRRAESGDDGRDARRSDFRSERGRGDDDGDSRRSDFKSDRSRGDDDGDSRRSDFRSEHSRGRGGNDDGDDFRTRFDTRGDYRGEGGPHRGHGRGEHDPPGNAYGLRRQDDDGHGRHENFYRNNGPGRGDSGFDVPLSDDGLRSLAASVKDLVRSLRHGEEHLPPDARRALDAATDLAGDELLRLLEAGKSGDKSYKILERAFEHALRTLEKAGDRGQQFAHTGQQFVHTRGQSVTEAVEEILQVAHLNRYLKQLEKVGGQPVRQAEEVIARLLYGASQGGNGQGGNAHGVGVFVGQGGVNAGQGGVSAFPPDARPTPAEILRDLRSGAFFPALEARSAFPLTGRARVVTEMMELMRTLDAFDRLARVFARADAGAPEAARRPNTAGTLGAFLGAGLAGLEALDEFLASLLPSLPGRAGRTEIPRLVAALGGMLPDPQGQMLVFTKDGVPLKLDQLLWLSTAGGLLGSSFQAEFTPVHLSPLLLYGFDAVYSVIGFDGRTLAQPHFAAVQAQINGEEMEWVFGQQPLTEGWMRALIERLKDSAAVEQNLFGETLEEALTEGRFHAVLVGGTVEEGSAVPDSFGVTKLLPGPTAQAAFA
ncbi:MAG TPA: hypothetical protein VGV38_11500 [Pyrinomonadaceae bacterium]|nr:hypothetical protein [Pyrinomonadaceae bacterium]